MDERDVCDIKGIGFDTDVAQKKNILLNEDKDNLKDTFLNISIYAQQDMKN